MPSRPALIAQSEAFVNLNSTDWGARSGMDQVRGMTGVSAPVGCGFALESGHQLQRVFGRCSQLNYTLPLPLVVHL